MSNQPRDELDDAIEQVEDQARAEGFAAGLFFGSTIAFEMGMMSPLVGMFTDLESLYPEVAGDSVPSEDSERGVFDAFGANSDEELDDLFDGTQDVAVEEMVEELESLEGEGIEATMFEPMDGYEDEDVPRRE